MSSINQENGDTIENPDPEADSEISDFANATEDEYHLKNYTENEIQCTNVTEDEFQSRNYDENGFQSNKLASDENVIQHDNEPEKNEPGIQTFEQRGEIKSQGSVLETDSKKTVDDIDNSSGNKESLTEQNDELVETDICDAPESEFGHDIPEAELCHLEDSSQIHIGNWDNSLDKDCSEIGTVVLEEQKHSNLLDEISGHVGRSSLVPQTLKLSKSESVESYEPECDQESLSPSLRNIESQLQQNVNIVSKGMEIKSVEGEDNEGDLINASVNIVNSGQKNQLVGSKDNEGNLINTSVNIVNSGEKNQSVGSEDTNRNVSNLFVNTESSCSEISPFNNMQNYENIYDTSSEDNSYKIYFQVTSNLNNEKIHMQDSYEECGTHNKGEDISGECVYKKEHRSSQAVSEDRVEDKSLPAVSEDCVEDKSSQPVSKNRVKDTSSQAVSADRVEFRSSQTVSEDRVEDTSSQAVPEDGVEGMSSQAVSEDGVEDTSSQAVSEDGLYKKRDTNAQAVSEDVVYNMEDMSTQAVSGDGVYKKEISNTQAVSEDGVYNKDDTSTHPVSEDGVYRKEDTNTQAVSEDELLCELDSALRSHENTPIISDCVSDLSYDNTPIISDCVSGVSNDITPIISDCVSGISNDNTTMASDSDISEETVIQDLQHKLSSYRQQLQRQEEQLERSKTDYSKLHAKLENVISERDRYKKELEVSKKHNADDLYIPQIKELEFTISQQQQEIRGLRDKLSSHDSSAKRAISALQVEMKQRLDQVTKVYRDAVSEKDNMVIKYAQAEKNNLSNLKNIERLESKLKDAGKDKDGLLGKIKDLKIEKTRLGHELDLKTSESQALKKEVEKLREQVSSSDVRIKWAQNKLRAELDAHKDTKANLEKTNQRLKEAKEETEQIRRNCQEIIKTYQESEEIKSNSLDQQLKEKQNELILHQTENKDKEELFTSTMKELEQLKTKHRETLAELHTYQDKTLCLEEEHKTDEDTLNKFKHLLQKQKSDNRVLQDKVEEMVQLQTDFKRAQKTIKSLDAEISELKINNKDLLMEIDACHKREAEKLELTEKLSAKNAELQSDNSLLNDKVIALSVEVQSLKMDINSHESSLEDLSKKLFHETTRSKQFISQLEEKVREKSKKVDELSTRIDDEKDEIKTLKRKHVNSIKDLTRQLQQARRKLETLETNCEKDSTSLGSRTSSTGSLNTITNGDGPNHSIQQVPAHTYRQASPPEQEYPVITEQVEPDKQMLIERIVKLQRMLARRNEKIEFMDDHAHQLIDDLQKKNKIIQMYALREESGMLTPESVDVSKAQIARKHSIMGSVYSSHQTDGTMTLDLSLEINRKLQAVLEDTLIKNMTLKESLDTLGEEIARLSQENRKMQLQLEKQKS